MASAELQIAIQMLRDNPPIQGETVLDMRAAMQAAVDNLPRPHDIECESVDAGGVPAEWVRAPGSREGQRTADRGQVRGAQPGASSAENSGCGERTLKREKDPRARSAARGENGSASA